MIDRCISSWSIKKKTDKTRTDWLHDDQMTEQG